jgi:hypothetical protein
LRGGARRWWAGGRARRVLLAAWSDLSSGFYEWAILKAWAAIIYSLSGPYGGLGPGGGWPSAAYMAAGLSESCRGLRGLLDCAAAVDAQVSPIQHAEVLGVLDIDLGYGRREALAAVECALRILNTLTSCGGEALQPAAPLGLVAGALEGFSRKLVEATVADVGGTVVVAVGEARGLPYAARLERLPRPLPPVRLLVLTPEEAGVLLSLPPWRGVEPDFIRDDYGLEGLAGGSLL